MSKITFKNLTNGLDKCDKLYIMGEKPINASQNEILFGGDSFDVISKSKTSGVEENINNNLTEKYYELFDINLKKDSRISINLLENIEGTYENVYVIDSNYKSEGKIPVYHSVKLINKSEYAFLAGNLILVDVNGS